MKRAWMALGFLAAAAPALAQAPAPAPAAGPAVSTARITQVLVDLPELRAWVDVNDAQGRTVPGLAPSAFRMAVDGTALELAEVAPPPVRAGTAWVLLVDVSRTMEGGPFAAATAAASRLVDGLKPEDRMAIVRFGTDVKTACDFTADPKTLKAALAGLRPTDGSTRLYLAVRQALDMLRRVDPAFPMRRGILLVTDGKDEGSGIKEEDLLNPSRQLDVPVLAIGYARQKGWTFDTLSRLAAVSGGAFAEGPDPAGIEKAFSALVARHQDVYLLRASWPAGRPDGARRQVQVTVASGGAVLPDNRIAAMVSSGAVPPDPGPAAEPGPEPVPEPVPDGDAGSGVLEDPLVLGGIGLALVAIVVAVVLATRGRRKVDAPPPRVEITLDEGPVCVYGPAPATTQEPPVQARRRSVARARLSVLQGASRFEPEGPVYDLPEEGLVVGRTGDVRVVGDSEVSSSHCRIGWSGGYFWVEDAGSRNGTQRNGDVIQAGRTRFRFQRG